MRILVMAGLVIASAYVYAQGTERGVVSFQAEGVVTTQSQVREAPPHGPFNLFVGKPIKSIDDGSQIEIIGKKTYSGFSGTHVWYQIEPIEEREDESTTPLWIYGGVEGKNSQVELEKIK